MPAALTCDREDIVEWVRRHVSSLLTELDRHDADAVDRLCSDMRDEWGGERHYVAAIGLPERDRRGFDRDERNAELRTAVRVMGVSLRKAARAAGVSLTQARRICDERNGIGCAGLAL